MNCRTTAITFPGGSNRRPLLVTVEDNKNAGLKFMFTVNHFNRSNDQVRETQAIGLRECAEI